MTPSCFADRRRNEPPDLVGVIEVEVVVTRLAELLELACWIAPHPAAPNRVLQHRAHDHGQLVDRAMRDRSFREQALSPRLQAGDADGVQGAETEF